MATFTTLTKQPVNWAAPEQLDVNQDYYLNIGSAYNLLIGGGYKLIIQPGKKETPWTTVSRTPAQY